MQLQAKPGQKKRGRSLTRQIAVSGNTKDTQDETHQPILAKEENIQNLKSNKTKSSPSKHMPRQSPSTPKTPTRDNTRQQQKHNVNYDENSGNQFGSRIHSTYNSVASSREPTPKISSSSKESAHEDKPGRKSKAYEMYSYQG